MSPPSPIAYHLFWKNPGKLGLCVCRCGVVGSTRVYWKPLRPIVRPLFTNCTRLQTSVLGGNGWHFTEMFGFKTFVEVVASSPFIPQFQPRTPTSLARHSESLHVDHWWRVSHLLSRGFVSHIRRPSIRPSHQQKRVAATSVLRSAWCWWGGGSEMLPRLLNKIDRFGSNREQKACQTTYLQKGWPPSSKAAGVQEKGLDAIGEGGGNGKRMCRDGDGACSLRFIAEFTGLSVLETLGARVGRNCPKHGAATSSCKRPLDGAKWLASMGRRAWHACKSLRRR